MGCDIHIWVEVKNSETGIWEHKDDRGPKPEYFEEVEEEAPAYLSTDLTGRLIIEDAEEYRTAIMQWEKSRPDYLYFGRNYNLFAILSGVRNYNNDMPLISKPRGIPKDASPEYLTAVEYWSGDGHSHSWHTVEQLNEFDWENRCKEFGVERFVKTLEALKKLGDPKNVRIVFFFDN